MSFFPSQGLVTAYRTGLTAADSTAMDTFLAAETTTVKVFGSDEIWARGTFSVAGATAVVRLVLTDDDDGLMWMSEEITLTATALRLTATGRYIDAGALKANVGATQARLMVISVSAGNVDLYLGHRSSSDA